MSEFFAEIIGTMLLIILGNGVVGGVVLKGTKSEGSGWIVITFGWGMAVALAIYAVGSISGAHINPAVTLGLASIGEFPWSKVPSYIVAQFIGAFVGAIVIWIHYLPHWKESPKDDQLAVFCTAPARRMNYANLFSEILGTFMLVLSIMFIGANEFTEGLNPVIIGMLIFSIGLSLGGTTGYAINPARDLGPRLAHAILPIISKGHSDWSYSWIPVVGPIIGGVGGAIFYDAVFRNVYNISSAIVGIIIIVIAIMAVIQQNKSDNTQ